jgi:hypothetical protein
MRHELVADDAGKPSGVSGQVVMVPVVPALPSGFSTDAAAFVRDSMQKLCDPAIELVAVPLKRDRVLGNPLLGACPAADRALPLDPLDSCSTASA